MLEARIDRILIKRPHRPPHVQCFYKSLASKRLYGQLPVGRSWYSICSVTASPENSTNKSRLFPALEEKWRLSPNHAPCAYPCSHTVNSRVVVD